MAEHSILEMEPSTINNGLSNGLNHEPNDHNTKPNDRFIVKYRQNYYNISEFIHKHPGGIGTFKGLNSADMTSRFMKAPPHSDAAMYLMNEYKIKSDIAQNGKSQKNGHIEHIILNENPTDSREKPESNNNNNNYLDESMEHLVDWSKAMLPQIPKITKHYDEWVHKPVDRPLRLFGPWYLEMLTKTPWWVVPLFWIPVIIKCLSSEFHLSWQVENSGRLAFLTAYFCVGILFWTLIEYSLHRWVFHMKTDANTASWICLVHFTIHGLHHKVPFDSYRLVFPPVPGVILAIVLYSPFSVFMPYPRVLLAGALFGYLCYDLMHYYLHYGNPSLQHMYHMKRYHYQHHFAHQDMGYGISSPLWDFIFNTQINLRHLKYRLRWR